MSFKWNALRYVLYFLLIPIGYLNPILNWLVIIIGPFLLFKSSYNPIFKEQKKYLLNLSLFLIVVVFTGFISEDPQYPIKNALNILSIILASYFITIRLQSKRELISFINGVFLASLIYTLLLYLVAFNGFTFDFLDSDTFGKNSSALILFIGLVALMLKMKLTKSSFFLKIIVFVFYLSIFFTGSIKIILVSLILLFIFIFFKYGFKIKPILLGLIGLFIFIFIVDFITTKNSYFDNYAVMRITSRISVLFGGESDIAYIDSDYMTEVRTNLINEGIELFYRNPILGIGLENSRLYLGTYTHNNFVEILAGTGIIGFYFFMNALFIVVKAILGVKKNQIKIILLASFMCFILIANAQRIYDNRYLLVFLVSFISIQKILNNEK